VYKSLGKRSAKKRESRKPERTKTRKETKWQQAKIGGAVLAQPEAFSFVVSFFRIFVILLEASPWYFKLFS